MPDMGPMWPELSGQVRNNDIGLNGIANDVAIISVRTVPDGDERDKDVADAIRYAANCAGQRSSTWFGKSYSWDKDVVDEVGQVCREKGCTHRPCCRK